MRSHVPIHRLSRSDPIPIQYWAIPLFCTPQILNQNWTVLERSTRGTRVFSINARSALNSFANLKEIVHLQHMGLNWDSHPVEIVENPLLCESFAWKHSPSEEIRIFYEWASLLSLQREHAQRFRPFISDAAARGGQTGLLSGSVPCESHLNSVPRPVSGLLHPWWRYRNTFLTLPLTTLSSNMTNCNIHFPLSTGSAIYNISCAIS